MPTYGANGASVEMPRYECHKRVWALKIEKVMKEGLDGAALLPEESGFDPIHVDAAYLLKHEPHAGGYYVVYKDGYKSFSPAGPFEEGYTRCR